MSIMNRQQFAELSNELGYKKIEAIFDLAEKMINERPQKRNTYVNRSKFKKGLDELSNQQLMFLSYCLIYDEQLVEMIGFWSKAVDNTVQILSLKDELLKRDMINKDIFNKVLIEHE